jgi:hypothetical protein
MKKVEAKTILDNKFWIVEDKGKRLGTLSLTDEAFLFNTKNGTEIFNTLSKLNKRYNVDIVFSSKENSFTQTDSEVYGYPTSCTPYNIMYDVKKKLPLFTKSTKSKSLYCAGFYTIHFDKGWVKSFCPKLITIERYENCGPFKTELEMRQQLSKVNAK